MFGMCCSKTSDTFLFFCFFREFSDMLYRFCFTSLCVQMQKTSASVGVDMCNLTENSLLQQLWHLRLFTHFTSSLDLLSQISTLTIVWQMKASICRQLKSFANLNRFKRSQVTNCCACECEKCCNHCNHCNFG